MKLTWEVKSTPRKVGTKQVWNEAKGKNTPKAITVDTPYDSPVVEDCYTLEDLNVLSAELLKSGKSAYNTVEKLVGHYLYGLDRHVAVMLNTGRDAKLSENQRAVVKTIANLVILGQGRPGTMGRAEAISYLTQQGIEDAELTFDAYLKGENGEGTVEEEEEETESVK